MSYMKNISSRLLLYGILGTFLPHMNGRIIPSNPIPYRAVLVALHLEVNRLLQLLQHRLSCTRRHLLLLFDVAHQLPYNLGAHSKKKKSGGQDRGGRGGGWGETMIVEVTVSTTAVGRTQKPARYFMTWCFKHASSMYDVLHGWSSLGNN